MSRTFATMKNNIAEDIQDTSGEMKTRIGRYINKRYFQILRAINWEEINDDYTISLTAGTQDYMLPSDYKEEIACIDAVNNYKLKRYSLQELLKRHYNELTTQGQPTEYAVWTDDNGDKKIKFHYNPDKAYTITFPYIIKPTELSADSDTPILNLEDLIELGARADALRYKRQYGKARDLELLFSKELQEYIWEHYNKQNLVYQFKPQATDRDTLY